ncbi:hypothetical protein Pmani_015734 [Petrolisthes manimaculis]|uniref:Uncharacterized protein n=1 Tax=Petrolisthes manimaculis TaxID=1843537 RepID=A0AAE1PQE2_9EUCA|nr:hypothetical protein Pmani_015734 [Petrolisthes manimaculis]
MGTTSKDIHAPFYTSSHPWVYNVLSPLRNTPEAFQTDSGDAEDDSVEEGAKLGSGDDRDQPWVHRLMTVHDHDDDTTTT